VATLILLRHGESVWNAEGRFAGWTDVPLSGTGREEAAAAGALLAAANVLPDVVHTSLLRRAVTTADIALDVAGRHWIPARRSRRLNERHYGALEGQRRDDVRAWARRRDLPGLAPLMGRRTTAG
jgi:2,3-bisphosphoglycerate-dependent phosphoglycerate mutase